LEPFADATYRRAAKEIAVKCLKYNIPPVFIEVFDQSGPVPAGLVRHDRTQNGRVLGKTDPGEQFDEAKFLALLKAEMEDVTMLEELHISLAERQEIYNARDTIARMQMVIAWLRANIISPEERQEIHNNVGRTRDLRTDYGNLLAVMRELQRAGQDGGVSEARARAIAQEEDSKLRHTK
ncbi:hypothetical protein LCGC14_1524420, partial [marine sediment metagenome]